MNGNHEHWNIACVCRCLLCDWPHIMGQAFHIESSAQIGSALRFL